MKYFSYINRHTSSNLVGKKAFVGENEGRCTLTVVPPTYNVKSLNYKILVPSEGFIWLVKSTNHSWVVEKIWPKGQLNRQDIWDFFKSGYEYICHWHEKLSVIYGTSGKRGSPKVDYAIGVWSVRSVNILGHNLVRKDNEFPSPLAFLLI